MEVPVPRRRQGGRHGRLPADGQARQGCSILRRAIHGNGAPVKVTIDKSGANKAGIEEYNDSHDGPGIEIRQCKYLNNIVEQDHRFVKQKMRAALGFKNFRTARATIMGVELVHMIRKGQVRPLEDTSDAQQFYALAA